MRLNLLPYSDEVSNLYALYGVERLELFGSAARPDFDPADSDLDFLVDFADAHTLGAFDRYFGLKEDLDKTFVKMLDIRIRQVTMNDTSPFPQTILSGVQLTNGQS